MPEHDVVITGLGVLSALGRDTDEFWRSLIAGRSGVRTLTGIDTTDLPVTYGGEIVDFDPDAHVGRASARRLDLQSIYGIVAGRAAMRDAGIPTADEVDDPDGFVILSPTGYGPTRIIEAAITALDTKGPRHVSPNLTVFGSPDTSGARLSEEFGARGENFSLAAACASGTVALGQALRMLRHGYASRVLVVGAEETLTRKDIASTANTRALATGYAADPTRASRPFDRDRRGFVMAAGAAAVLLETAEAAGRRGARVHARALGYGGTSDAYHPTAPHPEGAGASDAMRRALHDAGLSADAVDYVNAHGTGTQLNDRTEILALDTVLGARAREIPISSTKSMTGHLLGAAGVLECVVTALALRDGIAPPTINLDEPEFDGYDFVPHVARRHDMRVAMSNSFGFGGHNSAIVLGAAG